MKNIQCEILINGVTGYSVIDNLNPVFTLRTNGVFAFDSWQIRIFSPEKEIVWESGNISTDVRNVQWEDCKLKPKTIYHIALEVISERQIIAASDSVFETGILTAGWKARWIEPEQESAVQEEEIPFFKHFIPEPSFFGGHVRLKPCRQIKKEFTLSELPQNARIYASAHGIYDIKINGTRIADDIFLAPETSAYNSILYYQTYNPMPYIKKGNNIVEVTLADGWWIGRIGLTGDSCQYGDRLGFIMQAEFAMADGSTQVVCSDESSECRRSNIDYADLFIGQRTDFTREDEPWVKNCTVADYPTDNLTAQTTQSVKAHTFFNPKYSISSKGELIADFGQCMAGIAEISVDAAKGTEIYLDFSEVLDEGGCFYRNIIGRNKDQRDVYVCGDTISKFSPRFTYHGFRYIRISGVNREEIISLKALAIGTPIEKTGMFECSDSGLNQLQHMIEWSTRSNMVSVPTDCPQREKAGWTGDMLSFAPTGLFNFNLYSILSSWLMNMRVEQFQNGAVPIVIPNYPMQEKFQQSMNKGSTSSAWSDACIFVPWYMYINYGDKNVLKDNFGMMSRWLEYVAECSKELPENYDELSDKRKKWNNYLWNKGYHFGDWFIPSIVREDGGVMKVGELTKDVVGSCFYALSVETFLKVIDEISEDDSVNPQLGRAKLYYTDLLPKIKQAVRECFIEKDGYIENDLQGLYVIVLHAKIVNGELKKKVAARLAELIIKNDYKLDTGFVTVPYLLDVLTDNGYKDLAYRLIYQTESPSWLYMVKNGATTVWENWEAILPDGTVTTSSFNHYALGSVGSWIYRNIGGIDIKEAGYKIIHFAPDIDCGLQFASCSFESNYGQIKCAWEWNGDICSINITIPFGTTGMYEGKTLSFGEYNFTKRR